MILLKDTMQGYIYIKRRIFTDSVLNIYTQQQLLMSEYRAAFSKFPYKVYILFYLNHPLPIVSFLPLLG